jgi:hypothetical protein
MGIAVPARTKTNAGVLRFAQNDNIRTTATADPLRGMTNKKGNSKSEIQGSFDSALCASAQDDDLKERQWRCRRQRR